MISARRQGIFAEQRLYGLSVWTRQPIGELNVPRRNRSDTRRSRMLWIGSWRRFCFQKLQPAKAELISL